MNIVLELNRIRKEKGVKIGDLCRPMGLGRHQVSNLVNGRSMMSVDQLVVYCEVLGVELVVTNK